MTIRNNFLLNTHQQNIVKMVLKALEFKDCALDDPEFRRVSYRAQHYAISFDVFPSAGAFRRICSNMRRNWNVQTGILSN